jgi:hypothetical protein
MILLCTALACLWAVVIIAILDIENPNPPNQ